MFFLFDWLEKLMAGKPMEIEEKPEETPEEKQAPEKPAIHPKRKVEFWNS